jgi:hypothetical protein
MDEHSSKRCGRCQVSKPLSEFAPKGKWRQGYCRACVSEYYREYYRRNKAAYVARAISHNRKVREVVRGAKQRPCADCGQCYPYYVMDFDRREGEENICNVAELHGHRRTSLRMLLAEIAKCDVVCANCHRERTHQRKQAARRTERVVRPADLS